MITIMNEYISKIKLQTDSITKAVIENTLSSSEYVSKYTIQTKVNKFVIDIHLNEFDINKAVDFMNYFVQNCSYHYSSYYLRFNEGNSVRYRFATCKENKEGFSCEIIIR